MFAKELESHIECVNRIDEDTVKSLTHVQNVIKKLLDEAEICKNTTPNDFIPKLNGEHFESGRHIICRVCHVGSTIYSLLSVNQTLCFVKEI